MTMLRLMLAMVLPWLLGTLWMRAFLRARAPGQFAVNLGYGYFAGVLLTTVLVLAWDALGLRLHFWPLIGVLVLLGAIGFRLARHLWPRQRWMGWGRPWFGSYRPTWRQAAAGMLVLLIIVHAAGVALEVLWRPLYPWDAWMNWAPRARVWLETGALVPFLPHAGWQVSTDPQVRSLSMAGNYPPVVPLITLWPALALDRWDESLINLPWLLCGIALVLACYGQARALGASRLFATVLCYLLASLPFLNVHVALAGYADLWLAAFYALAIMAFLRWVWQGDRRQLALALLFILTAPFLKRVGLAWAFTFVPALIVALVPGRRLLWIIAIGGAAFIMIYWTVGIHITLPQIGEIQISPEQIKLPLYEGKGLEFQPEWAAFADNFFLLGNWHLFWYLAAGSVLLLPWALRDRCLRISSVLALSGFFFLGFVYFFTGHSAHAANYTSINRAFLHLVPGLLFIFAASLIHVLNHTHDRRQPTSKPSTGH